MRLVAVFLILAGIVTLALPTTLGIVAEKALQGHGESDSYFVVVHYPWWLLTGSALAFTSAAILWFRARNQDGHYPKS